MTDNDKLEETISRIMADNDKLETIIKDSQDFLNIPRSIAIQFIYKVMNHALREYKTLPKKDRDILSESLKQGM